MRLVLIIFALVVLSGLVLVQYNQVDGGSNEIAANVQEANVEAYGTEGFAKADRVFDFEFPADHGPHPDYQVEWWYYTGNLSDADGNRYGYQFTIFRRGIAPGEPERASEWGTRQIYFAHFTVTDVTGETFEAHERYSRAGAGLAGAQGLPTYHVWIDDWEAREIEPGKVRVKASDGDIGIDFILEQTKPIVLQGDDGLSVKSNAVESASYYYSMTNNTTSGTITTPRGTFAVTGNSWMDREWSTSILGDAAEGWDWFSLQLDDNREVMFFVIRLQDGRFEPASAGIIVNPDGSTDYLRLEDVEMTVLDTWTSPHTDATYPAEWQFAIPKAGINLHITPLLHDQELNVSFNYWEGAVKLEGSQSGYGYIELTGYAGSMQGRM
ncbi:MAG: carotenoid 1,2-hydratase [Anaerolineae bacterium]|nr:carotenoid 1,2-hydratase [Anaerolineae bacterium]